MSAPASPDEPAEGQRPPTTDPSPGTARYEALHWLGAFLAAAPCLYLSWVLLGVWADPMGREGGRWVRFGVGLMILEFVLLHSGAFMAHTLQSEHPLRKRAAFMAGLFLFYGLMVWAFAETTDSPALMWIFGAVVAGRVATAFTTRSDGLMAMQRRSGIGVMVYLLAVFGTVFLPLPEWGITRAVVAEVYPGRGGGLWEQQPHRAIAGAAFYFGLMGVLELTVLRKPPPSKTGDA